MTAARNLFLLLACAACLPAAGCAGRRPLAVPAGAESFIAHAGGLARGLTLTNSKEAFEGSYARCGRLLEADVNWSLDSELVLVHDFDKVFSPLFKARPGIYSLAEYRALKMSAGLTQWTLDDLVRWASERPGAYIVTDVKARNIDALRLIAAKYPGLRDRFIPQIYKANEFEYWTVRDLGFDNLILTLYETGATDEQILEFARRVKLFAVTMPADRARRSGLAGKLKARGVFVYAHTVNDPAEFMDLKTRGVQGVYSDELFPACPAVP